MDVARGINNARWRALALADVAHRLPTQEALAIARDIHDWWRSWVLANVVQRLPEAQALVVACGMDDHQRRVQTLANVAQRVERGKCSNFPLDAWINTIRVFATRKRFEAVRDFCEILPLIDRLGGEVTVRSFGRSINAVGRWWPSPPPSSTELSEKF